MDTVQGLVPPAVLGSSPPDFFTPWLVELACVAVATIVTGWFNPRRLSRMAIGLATGITVSFLLLWHVSPHGAFFVEEVFLEPVRSLFEPGEPEVRTFIATLLIPALLALGLAFIVKRPRPRGRSME